jgi:hypothetical protein
MFLLLVCIFLATCYKWGDWKNWKYYYPTILFFIAGDYIEAFATSEKSLWEYSATVFSGEVTHLITSLIIYPCSILLLLPLYPKSGAGKKFMHIILWVFVFTVLEYIEIKFKILTYYNGWRFSYSVLFDCVMIPLLILHQRKPPLAWLGALIFGSIIGFVFQLPVLH